ncbi:MULTISPECIES: tRNA lysidine(34) synthetase TilS [unclassified Polynucleobacter]|uniref:tRNA lysidine(34) synthetase TilS n=1 Tax=unclassified Polynucleobacter TaxID=2640945 RepID=UPI001BFCEF5C|nr:MULTISPECIES: tRNA lysidine(34) synthetase TilS [unclassified Polynucleobacter]MEA9604056.1 tRNA lysidine(34) synthetase TilS [Polynucleobacter sp. JS-JIR-II-c23]QWE03374.1 tRNA lysidine(34) synthetase TilS [Polynucleobacter sp. JS-JIR-II-b4]
MASSRKSQQSPKLGKRIAVALSGGLDSVVLLDMVCKAQAKATTQNKNQAKDQIYAFHIHHGLQKPADDWLIFCENLAKKYKIHFDFRLLHLDNSNEQGNVEARARAGRYEALADLCEEYGIEDLLLAHHQNDQAETVLLQLLRGSGVAGLSGMPTSRGVSSNQTPTLWRPLLNQSRQELEAYAKEHKLQWIEDPSNQDTKYRRNAVRKRIIPALEKIQPEALANMARSAELLGEAQTLLNRLATQDGKSILIKDQLKVSLLLALAKDDLPAANNVLRYWLQTQQLAMPSQERLQAWWRDLAKVKVDAKLEWLHDERKIYLWRGALQVPNSEEGRWVLKSLPANSRQLGLPADWVKAAQKNNQITLRERLGSEKIQIKPKTPRKTLKNLYQEADIPPWERQAPLLYINDELIAVAGIGLSYPHLTSAGKRVLPIWTKA